MIRYPLLIFSALLAVMILSPAGVFAEADAGAVEAAAEAPIGESVKTVIDDGKSIFADFGGGKYREAIAGLITLLIFGWRRFARGLVIGKLSPWWVGFVTVLLGFAGTIPEALATTPFVWTTFLWWAIATSSEAMLFWMTMGKKVLPKIFGKIAPKEE